MFTVKYKIVHFDLFVFLSKMYQPITGRKLSLNFTRMVYSHVSDKCHNSVSSSGVQMYLTHQKHHIHGISSYLSHLPVGPFAASLTRKKRSHMNSPIVLKPQRKSTASGLCLLRGSCSSSSVSTVQNRVHENLLAR